VTQLDEGGKMPRNCNELPRPKGDGRNAANVRPSGGSRKVLAADFDRSHSPRKVYSVAACGPEKPQDPSGTVRTGPQAPAL